MYTFILFPVMMYIPIVCYKLVRSMLFVEETPKELTYTFNLKDSKDRVCGLPCWSSLSIFFNYTDNEGYIHEFLKLVGPYVNEVSFDENICLMHVLIKENGCPDIRRLFKNEKFSFKCLKNTDENIEILMDDISYSDGESCSSDESFVLESKENEEIIERKRVELQKELDDIEDDVQSEDIEDDEDYGEAKKKT